MDLRRLDPVPPGRRCVGCGGDIRFSHLAYAGRGERVVVQICKNCGLAYRGGRGDLGGEAGGQPLGRRAGGGEKGRSRKPLPDEGAPPNPVIDDESARLLRERFGGA